MIKFKELSIRNFLSYGNNVTTFNLDFTSPTLIVGRNYDEVTNGQITSNGAGKSTILNAISVCLYDEAISNIAKSEWVNYINAKNMEVSIVFESNNIHYKVVRYRKNKALGGDGVRLYINEKEAIFGKDQDKTNAGITNVNKEIEKILRLPFPIFSRIVVILASYEPFLSLPASSSANKDNQRDIIEELFGLTELSEKAEKLSILMKTQRIVLKDIQTKNEHLYDERERQNAQIESTENKMANWAITNATNIKEVKVKLKNYVSINFDEIEGIITQLEAIIRTYTDHNQLLVAAKRELDTILDNNRSASRWEISHTSSIEKLELELAGLQSVDVEYLMDIQSKIFEYTADLNLIRRDIQDVNTKVQDFSSKLTKKENEVAQLSDNQCPYCKQPFHDAQEKKEECAKAIETINKSIEETIEPLTQLKKGEIKIVELLAPIKDIKIPLNLKNIESSVIQKKSELDTIKKQSNPFTIKDTVAAENKILEKEGELSKIEFNKKSLEFDLTSHKPDMFGVPNWTRVTVQKINSEIDNLADKLQSYKDAINPFGSVVKELKDNMSKLEKPDEKAVDEASELLDHQEFLYKLLTKKDSFVRKALLTKNIPFLNTRLDHYLNLMGLNHKVLFTEEMGVNISKFGTQWSYGNLSGGQKARVNLALSFAFRDVLQARYTKINFCMLDECLDTGLDDVGVGLAAKTIKNVAISEQLAMLVISHKGEISNLFDSKLEVELRNGFTNVLPHPLVLETNVIDEE